MSYFEQQYRGMRSDLLAIGADVNTGQWQSQSGTPHSETVELQFRTLEYEVPDTHEVLVEEVQPNLPWAEDHFQERVSGIPYNPPPSAAYWPFAQKDHAEHTDEAGKFSHTYPERLWGINWDMRNLTAPQDPGLAVATLNDLISLLSAHPGTRQAFVPIWWPIDGAMAGKERVPCTIGYHFMIRDNELHCHYFMRSCDFLRHFRDDVYMACRLMQWVANVVSFETNLTIRPCRLVMPISSLHVFRNDLHTMRYQMKQEAA